MSAFYCSACSVGLADESHLQVHLGTVKHKSMMNRTDGGGGGGYQLMAARRPGAVGDAAPKQKRAAAAAAGVNILECELCNVTCLSLATYQTHINGARHARKLKEAEYQRLALAKDPSVFCAACNIVLPPQLMASHLSGKKHHATLKAAGDDAGESSTGKKEAAKTPNSAKNGGTETSPKPEKLQQLLTKLGKDDLVRLLGKRFRMECSACSTPFTSFSQAEHHYNSKAHRNAYLERQKEMCLAKGKKCDVCDVIVGSSELYEVHVKGYKHTLRAHRGQIPSDSEHYAKFLKLRDATRDKN